MQQKDFQLVRTFLFDGESALRSAKVKKQIYTTLNIKIHAQPFYKRNMAERAIKEIKLRMAMHLDFQGKKLFSTMGDLH